MSIKNNKHFLIYKSERSDIKKWIPPQLHYASLHFSSLSIFIVAPSLLMKKY